MGKLASQSMISQVLGHNLLVAQELLLVSREGGGLQTAWSQQIFLLVHSPQHTRYFSAFFRLLKRYNELDQ